MGFKSTINQVNGKQGEDRMKTLLTGTNHHLFEEERFLMKNNQSEITELVNLNARLNMSLELNDIHNISYFINANYVKRTDVERILNPIKSIVEYWNRSDNQMATADACEHNISCAEESLTIAEEVLKK